jgi:hypothetical protein
VVRIDVEQVQDWSDEEIARRWLSIFSGPLLMHQHLGGADLTEPELEYIHVLFATWRHRLSDLSWFMRCLNEPIARMANAEDHCTGRFWEGRFKSQALLDARAVLACMAYVDLNPIRAAMASTPPILTRMKMDAAPVLNYLGKADQPTFGALGPVSMLRAFASSVGRSFIKGQSLGKQLCPETT